MTMTKDFTAPADAADPSGPRTSRVVRFHETGGPEVLRIEELPLAVPGPGELRIAVQAIGLNRAEAAFRAGRYLEPPELPARLGYEASGCVDALGPGVAGFRVGDPVCVLPALSMSRHGVYGDHAVVPASAVIHRPPGLDAVAGAAAWMALLTAYGALVDIGRIGAGDAVVITAASSSVGIAAIQLCRRLGALPVAVTRDKTKVPALEAQGAARVVVGGPAEAVHGAQDLTGGRGARLVLDPVAGPGAATLAEALAPGGTLVLYGNLSGLAHETPFPFFTAVGRGLAVRGYLVFELLREPARLAPALAFLSAGLADGSLRPVIARRFDLAEIVAAHRYLESNQQVGKVVVLAGREARA